MERYTIRHFNDEFPDDDACLEHVARLVYPTFPQLPCRECERTVKHHRLSGRKAYSCQLCGTQVYPLAGTIFEKSRTPLKSWFYAMYLMSTTRMGISAKQLERELGVTYKTAWRMFKQIRTLMDEESGPLSGTVEVDETYEGGRPRYRQSRRGPRLASDPTAKRPIVGMVERGGSVRAYVTPDTKTRTIEPLVKAHVMPDSTVFTDEAMQYGLLRRNGYEHRRVHHSARVYVDGDVHTNTIEGFWSLLKNGIRGAHRAVGAGYLQDYVNEYVFRYNHRDDVKPMFRTISERVSAVRDGRYGSYAPLGDA
jgi:transposase-like protein